MCLNGNEIYTDPMKNLILLKGITNKSSINYLTLISNNNNNKCQSLSIYIS